MVDNPRLQHFDYATQNTSYFVTVRFKAPMKESVCENLFTKMLSVFDESDYICDALVVMPDHLHIVTTKATENSSRLSDLMCMLKSKTLYFLKKEDIVVGTFWQRGYYDHIIRNEADWIEKIHYIIGNPIRAGLTVDSESYQHLYCRFIDFGATQGRPLRGSEVSSDK